MSEASLSHSLFLPSCSLSLTLSDSPAVISVGAMGCDWLVAAGQSKLLRPALYLAVNALLSLSFSRSLSLSFSLPHFLCPFRKRNEQKRKALQHGNRQKKKRKTVQRQMLFVVMDTYGGRQSGSGEMGKRAMEHQRGAGWGVTSETQSKHFPILHLPPA